jgi:hypothetical protein
LARPELAEIITDDDYVSGLERAHHGYLGSGEARHAARCAW